MPQQPQAAYAALRRSACVTNTPAACCSCLACEHKQPDLCSNMTAGAHRVLKSCNRLLKQQLQAEGSDMISCPDVHVHVCRRNLRRGTYALRPLHPYTCTCTGQVPRSLALTAQRCPTQHSTGKVVPALAHLAAPAVSCDDQPIQICTPAAQQAEATSAGIPESQTCQQLV